MQILLFCWHTGRRPAKPCLLDTSSKLSAWLINYMQRPIISKVGTGGWRDYSAVKSSCCSSRGHEFGQRKRLVICFGLLKRHSSTCEAEAGRSLPPECWDQKRTPPPPGKPESFKLASSPYYSVFQFRYLWAPSLGQSISKSLYPFPRSRDWTDVKDF